MGKDGRANLPLTRDLALGFSRMLLSSQTPAWQRQQAVKTLAVYRDLVLETEEPLLTDVIRKLGQLAEQERGFGAAGAPDNRDVVRLVGQIDMSESLVAQQMRRELRLQGKSLETEHAYVGWVSAGFSVVSVQCSVFSESQGVMEAHSSGLSDTFSVGAEKEERVESLQSSVVSESQF